MKKLLIPIFISMLIFSGCEIPGFQPQDILEEQEQNQENEQENESEQDEQENDDSED